MREPYFNLFPFGSGLHLPLDTISTSLTNQKRLGQVGKRQRVLKNQIHPTMLNHLKMSKKTSNDKQ